MSSMQKIVELGDRHFRKNFAHDFLIAKSELFVGVLLLGVAVFKKI